MTHVKVCSGMLLLVIGSRDGGCPVFKLSTRVINSPMGLRLNFNEERNEFEEL